MLKSLSIKNYILIDNIEVKFNEGLSIITGETGAGKSILLGALSLILGSRADASSLYDKTNKCVIEGSFYIKGYGFESFFKRNDLDYYNLCILRREINKQGRSRAFINDTPVTLDILKSFSTHLVDIHSQHKTLALNESGFQLAVIDNFAETNKLLEKYRTELANFKRIKAELKELIEKDKKAKSDRDYFQFHFDELEEAGLHDPDEQTALEEEQKLLTNAEEIKTSLFEVTELTGNNEQNLVSNVNHVVNVLAKIKEYHTSIEGLYSRMDSLSIELADIHNEMERIVESVNVNPQRMGLVNERLDLIYSLQHKHSVSSIGELIEKKNNLEEKLSDISNLEEKIAELKAEVEDQYKKLIATANQLSNKRQGSFKDFVKRIESKLNDLAMENARFSIDHKQLEEPGQNGLDAIRFLFNANKGADLQEISKAASGGELSRLMLAIKSLVTEKKLLSTIIFDEIDTGVSGEIAGKVGDILKEMSYEMQVIAITHIPQIAGKGQTHYKVFKSTSDDTTLTSIRVLNNEERIKEIAVMLSGNQQSEAASETAKQLLTNN
jgi:DNA repair protein RecN (Recombination protein N)